jgi:hypothetical protein
LAGAVGVALPARDRVAGRRLRRPKDMMDFNLIILIDRGLLVVSGFHADLSV